MAKAKLNGINVHYQVKGEGPDVILVHGITSSLAIWYMRVTPALVGEFRVTAYDLRGHGYTDMTRDGYRSDQMAGDLFALMDHLGIERARIVGHSFGGAIGLHAALLQPERVEAVAVSDTGIACLRDLRVIKDWPGWDLWKDELAAHGISYDKFTDDADRIIRRSFEIPKKFGIGKGQPRGTRRLQRLVDETEVIREFREVAGLTRERIGEITVPVLALYGEISPYRKVAAWLAENVRHCRWDILAGTGHFFLLESPDLFVERILAFLRDPVGVVAETNTPDANADGTPATREA